MHLGWPHRLLALYAFLVWLGARWLALHFGYVWFLAVVEKWGLILRKSINIIVNQQDLRILSWLLKLLLSTLLQLRTSITFSIQLFPDILKFNSINILQSFVRVSDHVQKLITHSSSCCFCILHDKQITTTSKTIWRRSHTIETIQLLFLSSQARIAAKHLVAAACLLHLQHSGTE